MMDDTALPTDTVSPAAILSPSSPSTPPSLAMVFVIALGCSAMTGYLSWHFARTPAPTLAILDNQKVIDALNRNPDALDDTLARLDQRLRRLQDQGVIVLDARMVKTPDLPEVLP